MADAVTIENLGLAIAARLQDYTQEVTEGVVRAVEDTARETRDLLKRTSPKDSPSIHGYAKGWTIRWTRRDFPRAIIHAGKNYRLTHLLEKGHAKANGGRVAAMPHIQLAEDWARQQLANRIEDAVNGARV